MKLDARPGRALRAHRARPCRAANIRTSSTMCCDGDEDALPPRALHPIFFGSFDWHSCVHGWWTLLTLRRLFPGHARGARRSPTLADAMLHAGQGRGRARLSRPRRSAAGSSGPTAGRGCSTSTSRRRGTTTATGRASSSRSPAPSPSGFATYLPKLTYPIRVGTHFNTAFALILALDWAEAFDPALAGADPRARARLVRRRPRLPGVGAGRRRIPVVRR